LKEAVLNPRWRAEAYFSLVWWLLVSLRHRTVTLWWRRKVKVWI